MSESENHAVLAAEWDAWVAKCNGGSVVMPDQLTLQELTLQERVRRFNLGTPTAMHVCTHELVNDLWRELESMSGQPANANPSPPVRQHSGDRSAHTPGPWEFNSISPLNGWLEGANGKTIFHCDPDPNETPNDADARLIAAAPEMLAALELGLHLVQVRWPMTSPESEPEKSTIEFINTAERAIVKATGA